MYPVPHHASELEQAWSGELAPLFGRSQAEFQANPRKHMSFSSQVVRVELMDSSFAEFRWAFAVVSESRKAIAVFTEHCGHHLFPYHEARVFVDGRLTYEQHAA